MTTKAPSRKPAVPKQALAAKIFHWINLGSLLAMMGSGLQIYNANPVFGGREGFHFPDFLIVGGWLAGGRHWHFFFMWLFGLNLLWYGIYILVTRRWQNRYVGKNDLEALQKGKNPKRRNYALHRLVYTSMFPILLMALFTGLGMYKPVQFGWIVELFGSWQALRTVHFLTVPLALGLMAVHSLLALQVGQWKLVRSIFA
ncbi:cytochrome b/b6 domain-containing protein [Gloeobacter kilaueensis]|uniref:Thiosulfate reductase cytochrome B subunit (Membrane anchoring protein) n=1 Tax=Gloeobacter kilaueensis (strain ATCC BAA-2537 / CCAP 1431/1 / ULC 316 / JS1) TaxID=1183438 RepID=U5QG61_GLOK1|nr:cytochrome b/b6 domain-containing protein [Gloeobacter kilaueensis]AGY57906.1 thiosulfate reductase cytochrome B subunit (membrane anchoring protein) [Gloeobacter kilaueensis JS1]